MSELITRMFREVKVKRETCRMCGRKYEDYRVGPKTPFDPYWCDECEKKAREGHGNNKMLKVQEEKGDSESRSL